MSAHAYTHLVQHAFKHSETMPPVKRGKNPFVGFLLGFVFGPIGVGVYLGSVTDFAMSLGMVIIGSLVTGGIAAPVLWTVCGVWAAVRIRNSNTKHAELDRVTATKRESVPTDATPSA
ncbi:MAG: hypothetical protein K2X32_07500 [Phycisphaerales bacterium]|nr:hypothetical protein [Phycisphaerales bacterium]